MCTPQQNQTCTCGSSLPSTNSRVWCWKWSWNQQLTQKRFQGLKATNEQQDNGTGILHQVAQHPKDQVYLYKRRPSPSPLTQHPERRHWLQGKYVYVLPTPPTPCSDGQLKCVGNESFTDDLSRASNLGQADARPELYHYTTTYAGLQVLL